VHQRVEDRHEPRDGQVGAEVPGLLTAPDQLLQVGEPVVVQGAQPRFADLGVGGHPQPVEPVEDLPGRPQQRTHRVLGRQ
jgi:hypothetical protein